MKPTLLTPHKQQTPPRPSDELFGHICWLLTRFYEAAEAIEAAKTKQEHIAARLLLDSALAEARKANITP